MGLTNVDLYRIDGNVGSLSNVQTSALNGGPLAGARNRIINGDMRIDQRNAGASVTGGVGYTFPVDRFKFYSSVGSKLSGQRSTTAPSGFTNSLILTSLASTTPAAGDEYNLYHLIEGFNVADFGWGAANAQSVTLSFWARSSLTGTFAGCLCNSSGNRSYVFTYTISAANTYEYKTITIAGDTTGSWASDNASGIHVIWDLGSGSNFNGTAGSWSSSYKVKTSGSTSIVGTNGATFYITGVQLEAGTVATPFERRSYGQELSLCQRYYQNYAISADYTDTLAATYIFRSYSFPVTMRTVPSLSVFSQLQYYSLGSNVNFTPNAFAATTSGFYAGSTGLTNARGLFGGTVAAASEL